MDLNQLVFYFFSGFAVASAILMITRKSPVYSAVYLVLTLFAIAAIFVTLNAHFLAALQVVIYTGAILVLFLFVIMLLNLGEDFDPDIRGQFVWIVGIGVGLVLLAELLVAVRPADDWAARPDIVTPLIQARGAVAAVAHPVFTDFILAVEITALLLLVAMVGAVVVARRGT
ncbi:MAG: NADH-quinone oxidoreductase subunit J [Gemmatimonadota bacterium]